ncbi:NAD(P)/FAD-dependent oxidoreductase [Latilactobacillus sakei]|uniref:NAD(P)/FAD-dependent oxidoreductase n=1 Tax=Latilactobacillus sakei TaxID=1599 RepID=UPI003A8BE814
MTNIYEITIIGGGPAGLYAAFQAGLYGLNGQLLEGDQQFGGKVATYAERVIHDIGGMPNITGQDLIQNLTAQAAFYDTPLRTQTLVTDVKYLADQDYYQIDTPDDRYYSQTLILAMGGGVVRPKQLRLFEEQTFENVHYAPANPEDYRDQRVVLIGPGYNWMELAPHLLATAKSVVWLTTKRPFVDEAAEKAFLTAYPQIDYYCQPFASYQQVDQQVTSITLADQTQITFDQAVVSLGYRRSLQTIDQWQLSAEQIEERPDIWVIGNQIPDRAGISLLTSAFQDGITAITEIVAQLKPTAKTPMVTTHNPVFQADTKAYWQERLR